VWSTDGTGEPVILRGHEAAVFSAAFSPDGKRIVTASGDMKARVWSADGTGKPLILRLKYAVFSAAFSPDGKRVVTACDGKTTCLWSTDGAGEPLGRSPLMGWGPAPLGRGGMNRKDTTIQPGSGADQRDASPT
jgi:WD40 repeat protein